MLDMTIDEASGRAVWEDVLVATRVASTDDPHLPTGYQLEISDPEARATLDSFWRVFTAIRVYRQLGTAQAEAVCSSLFTGQSIGMSWREALDAGVAPEVVLEACHESALKVVRLEDLQNHQLED